MKKALLGGVAAIAVIAAASASGPAAAQKATNWETTNWTGPYVGVHAGGGWADADVEETSGGKKIFGDSDPSGPFGGIQAGYDRQLDDSDLGLGQFNLGAFVLGAVADLSGAGLDDEFDLKADAGGKGPPALVQTKYDWLATLRARAGWLATPNALLYAHGGVAWANIELRETGGEGPFAGGFDDDYDVGWTAGAGGELKVSDNFSLFIEYSYMDFGKENKEIKSDKAADHDNDLHLLKGGMNFRFANPFGPAAAPMAANMGTADWTGAYVGAHAGGGWADADVQETSGGKKIFGDSDPSGPFGGLQVGYDRQLADSDLGLGQYNLGAFVLGAVADVSWAGIDDEFDLKADAGGKGPPALVQTKYDWLATLRARAGWLAIPNALVYAHAGVAWANIELRETGGEGPFAGGFDDDYDVGWTAGAGGELKVSNNFSLFIEYSYMDFGEENKDIKSDKAADHDNDLHVLKGGMNYRFDSFLSGNTQRTAANRHDAIPSRTAPAKISRAQPLAREPKPRIEAAALAPSKEPPRAVVQASTRLDTGSQFANPKQPFDQGLISGSDNAEVRNPVLPAMFAAKDDLMAPEMKPVVPEPSVRSDEGVVKVVFAPQEARGSVVDRESRSYIRWVQRSLNLLLGTRLDVDGVMGQRTHNVIRSFQRQVGIGVDGVIGPQTENALIRAGASSTRAA